MFQIININDEAAYVIKSVADKSLYLGIYCVAYHNY